MKPLIVFLCLSFTLHVYSQTDTIFKNDGEVILVNVSEITETAVKFVYPGESFNNSLGKNTIKSIHFKSGRRQEFSSSLNLSRVKGCKDWEKVQVSRLESEIVGLYKIDMIGAKAKGATTLSSLAKLQDRAYNKIKIQTAMLGGNVAYILEQNTEEAIFGGEEGSSKTPGVTLSGLAYTTRKVKETEISEGRYNIAAVYMLQANEMEIEQKQAREESIELSKSHLKNHNGFPRISLHIAQVKHLREYTIIYADDTELVLSGVHSSRQGKKRYYNIYLKKAL